jgi:catechol 2,3-dioxygenase-like lactoylglutathione lyase family enzyme
MAGPFRTIDHVQLAMPAGGEDRARAFFRDLLGMDEIPKPAELAKRGGCWFQSDDVQIHVGVDPNFHPAGKAHPGLKCTNLRDLITRFRESGIECSEDNASGVARAFVHDPFGNRIELIG